MIILTLIQCTIDFLRPCKYTIYLPTSYKRHSFLIPPIILFYFADVQGSVSIPVLIGSGVTMDNFQQYKAASALIIGSYFKQSHHWANQIDAGFVKDFMDMVKKETDN